MRRRRVDSGLERQFLVGLITSKPFLASAAGVLDLGLVQTDLFRTVAKWCVDYHTQYGRAPGADIEGLYHAWAETEGPAPELAEAVHDFLEGLSRQHDQAPDLNVPYLLDELGNYLTLRKLQRAKDELEQSLLAGDMQAGLRVVNEFRQVQLGEGVGLDPLNDRAAWRRAFAEPMEPLFTFGGDAGKFLNQALTRDSLVGIQAPEKSGKTWWCVELVMRALRARRKVALFEVGDLTESQIMLRLGMRLSGRPLWASQCGDIAVPTKIERADPDETGDEKLKVLVEHKMMYCPDPVTRRACIRGAYKYLRACGIPRETPYLMLSVHSNSSINVRGIEGVLARWEHERGFVPDVIVIDYADILAPEESRKDTRDQVNDTWKALRRLSQERRCLVLAPTQANRGGYMADVQDKQHSSEDKRKLSHVTGMLGLNRTSTESDAGVMRLNWVVLRESEFNTKRCLYVAQCLPLGRAYCCGTL